MTSYPGPGALLLALFLSLLLLGCEEDVASVQGDTGPFSIFGILNPRLETQTIAVFPIAGQIDFRSTDLDAMLTSTQLQSGETVAWTDSVISDSLGEPRHVFWAEFVPEYGHDYEISLSREDGATSVATTHVPSRVKTRAAERGVQTMVVIIDGDRFRVLAASLTYEIGWGPDGACEHPRGRYEIDYRPFLEPASSGYSFEVNMVVAHEKLLAAYLAEHPGYQWTPTVSGLVLFDIALDLIIADPAWSPPNGEFDPHVLVQPGTMSNVTNGYGFIGAGFYETASIVAPSDIVGNTWFFDFQAPDSQC